MALFKDRQEAGKKLAVLLEKYASPQAIIYALPRGGVMVAKEIAEKIQVPLDLVMVRKIGHPYNPEYAIGAISETGVTLYNAAEKATVDNHWLKKEEIKEQAEAKRRRQKYVEGRAMISPKNKVAILVDDGIATGLSMFLAIKEIKKSQPQKIIVAIPVVPYDTLLKLRRKVDDVIYLEAPQLFLGAVGNYYDDFQQTEDEEVMAVFKKNTQ